MDLFESALERILSFILMFSNDTILVPLIVVGYLCVNRQIFYHGACLLLLSMVINFTLKVTSFQIVSYVMGSSHLAFPSGHMLSSVVLYGWLAYSFQQLWFRYGVILLLSSIGCALIYNDYHDYSDILGSVFFALLLLLQYIRYMPQTWSIQSMPLIVSSILILYISLMHGLVPHFVWLAYYALWGFIVGELYFASRMLKNAYSKSVAVSTAICLITLCYFLGQTILLTMPYIIAQFPWFVIGLSPSLACYLQHKIHRSNITV